MNVMTGLAIGGFLKHRSCTLSTLFHSGTCFNESGRELLPAISITFFGLVLESETSIACNFLASSAEAFPLETFLRSPPLNATFITSFVEYFLPSDSSALTKTDVVTPENRVNITKESIIFDISKSP